jgi:hypothetical protein
MSRMRWIWWVCTEGEAEKGDGGVGTETVTTQAGRLGLAMTGMVEAKQQGKKNMVILMDIKTIHSEDSSQLSKLVLTTLDPQNFDTMGVQQYSTFR